MAEKAWWEYIVPTSWDEAAVGVLATPLYPFYKGGKEAINARPGSANLAANGYKAPGQVGLASQYKTKILGDIEAARPQTASFDQPLAGPPPESYGGFGGGDGAYPSSPGGPGLSEGLLQHLEDLRTQYIRNLSPLYPLQSGRLG